MRFRKNGLATHIVFGLLVALSNAQRSLRDLEGVYSGDAIFPTYFAANDEGGFTNYCREEFPEACRQEVGYTTETVTINATTIALVFSQAPGITTIEESIEAYPSCAPTGRYPIEFSSPLPPAEIQSFDPSTGHLTFIDSRRPDDVNCVIVQTEEESQGQYLRINFLIVSLNMTELETVTRGPSFRCVTYNDLCVAETSTDGNFVSVSAVEYRLPCVSGACMDSEDK